MRTASMGSRTLGQTKIICKSLSSERIGSDGSLHIRPTDQRGTTRSGKVVGHVPEASPMSSSQHDELIEAIIGARRVVVLTGEKQI